MEKIIVKRIHTQILYTNIGNSMGWLGNIYVDFSDNDWAKLVYQKIGQSYEELSEDISKQIKNYTII